jgi:ubiquinone/menaquinone biosynthesis C-methylase UbiE
VFLPIYDLVTRVMGADRLRAKMLGSTELRPGDRVLDVGCGTGTLAVLLKERNPEVEVTGLDPDPRALARAARKAAKHRAAVRFDQGFADRMPYADGGFQQVFSSYMFHHLPAEQRLPMLREIRRALAPRGVFHLLDFAAKGTGGDANASGARANTPARITAEMAEAGLVDVALAGQESLMLGLVRVAYYRAAAPPR